MNLIQFESPCDREWHRAHDELSRLAKSRARLDWEEGRALVAALRAGVHVHLGFGTFAEYVERLFGYKPRWTEERLRVAEALESLPELERSLRDGAIPWSTARELTRVAVADTEHDWLEAARGRTLRQIEDLVAGRALGDGPSDRPDANLRRHVLRFEVAAETFATFREAIAKIRRDAGSPLDDDEALLLLARHLLGGPLDAGRASYQVALSVCDHCGRGWQQGAGQSVEVNAHVVEMARCDAQSLGAVVDDTISTHVGASPRAHQRTRPSVRRAVIRRDGGRCVVPGCRNGVFLDVHHIVLRSEGGADDPDCMIVLCGAHHRAQHRGQLIIEGRVSTGLVFHHADGSSYGAAVSPATATIYEEAFRGLRSLGFREGEIRAALHRVRSGASSTPPTLERVLRAAISALTPRPQSAPARSAAHPD